MLNTRSALRSKDGRDFAETSERHSHGPGARQVLLQTRRSGGRDGGRSCVGARGTVLAVLKNEKMGKSERLMRLIWLNIFY